MDQTYIVIAHHTQEKQERAKELRRQMTPAENLLWQYLRNNRLGSFHFRRQQVLDGFIADFYCHAAGLVIEVDGAVHKDREEYDSLRDQVIAARNLLILRFTNDHIENDLDSVLDEILKAAHERTPIQYRNSTCLPRKQKRVRPGTSPSNRLAHPCPIPCERSERIREGDRGVR